MNDKKDFDFDSLLDLIRQASDAAEQTKDKGTSKNNFY
jgi:hypothetical protein